MPFGDLEPRTTNENEPLAKKLPSMSSTSHIGKLVSDLQTAIDKLDADVQAVIRKQEELCDATKQAEIPAAAGPSTSNEEFSWDRVRVDPEVLHAV